MNRPRESNALFPQSQGGLAVDAESAFKLQGAQDLRTGLHRVQGLFVTFVVVCVAALALCFPRLSDQPRKAALKDLSLLSSEMDVETLRRQMAAKAERELAFDLDRVTRVVALPELTAKLGAGPQAQLQTADVPKLTSLAALADSARSGTRFSVRGPRPEDLAASLRWRLDRRRDKHPLVLSQLQLSHGVGLESVDGEAVVEPARVEALLATAAYEQSYALYTSLRDQTDGLRKQGLSKKDMLPAVQERVAAYKVVEEHKKQMQRATTTYGRRVRRALMRNATAEDQAGGGTLVVATLEAEGEKPLEVKVPLSRPARLTTAPAFKAPASLSRLQLNPLWPELKSLDAALATQHLEQQVSFHLQTTELAGLRISGLVVLQTLPLVLLFFVWMLTRGCRAVTHGYSPFGSNQGARIPTPGTGTRTLDRALLVILPVVVCSLICASLWRLQQSPWIAAALSFGVLAQSLVASRLWKELHRLLDVARHRSLVQPLPERMVAAVQVTELRRTGNGR